VDLETRVAMAPTKFGKWLRRVAEKRGGAQDQLALGSLYYAGGEGLKQDRVAAAAWFRKAAAQEHPGAHYLLGV
jgi:TPR repeat protein